MDRGIHGLATRTLTRSELLKRAAAVAGGVALGRSLAGPSRSLASVSRDSLVPSGTSINGINLVSTPSDPGYDGSWPTLFVGWPWAQSLKPQIDLARGQGANAARLIGGMGAVSQGRLTLSEYVAEYEQFVAYCQSEGMYVQAVGADIGDMSGVPQATVIGYSHALVEMLNGYSNVVCLDIVSEIIGQGYAIGLGSVGNDEAIIAYAQALYSAIKPLSSIPMGFSHSYPFTDYRVAELAPYCDYVDFHVYPGTVPTGSSPASALDAYPTKAFIMGEWGDPISDTQDGQVAHADYVLGLVQDWPCNGAWKWSAVDQLWASEDYAYDNFGLFPTVQSTGPRQDIAAVFCRFPGSPAVSAATPVVTDQPAPAVPVSSAPVSSAPPSASGTAVQPAAPVTKLAKAQISSKHHTATFHFKATGDAPGFQCALVREPSHKGAKRPSPKYSSCRSPKVFKDLPAGTYVFYVRAVGPGGIDKTPASHKFKIT